MCVRFSLLTSLFFMQVISGVHLRVVDGVGTLLQMQALASRLCGVARGSMTGALTGGGGGGGAGGGGGGR